MAVAVDPFSFATVELSEEYVNVFPHPDIIPKYLETVCDKTGVQLLTGIDAISIKGPWLSVKKAHTFLADFLISYQTTELVKDQKDAGEFDNYHDYSDVELSPVSSSVAKFDSGTGELSNWLKWTAEVLPRIQRKRSKRVSLYTEPKSQTTKVPEPLVLYADFQPTLTLQSLDPAAKKPPTLHAIEKVLKKVYDKDKEANSDCLNISNDIVTDSAVSGVKEANAKLQQRPEVCTTNAELVNVAHNQSVADISKHEEQERKVLIDNFIGKTCAHVDQTADDGITICLSNTEKPVDHAVSTNKYSINSGNTLHLSKTEQAIMQILEPTDNGIGAEIISKHTETDSQVNVQSGEHHAESLPPTCAAAKLDQENQEQMLDSLKKVNSVQRASNTRRKGGPKKKGSYLKKKTEEPHPERALLSSSVSRAERAAKRGNRENQVQKTKETIVSPEKKKRGRPPTQSKTQMVDIDKEEEDKDYVCEVCSYVTKKLSNLREHKRRVHITKEFKCDKCGKVFGYGKDLKRHRITHQKAENCCDICGKMYKGVRTLSEHKKTHNTNYIKPEFPCEFCRKTFSTKYVLAYHIRSEHLGIKKTYLCPICGKSFSQRNSYLQHANVHMGIKPYQCDICGRSFSYEKSLKEHKYMHEDNKQFECPECHKKFRQSSGVAIHMKIHKEHKDYVCSACGKGFSQKQALIRHERIHVGEKPFNCALCQRKFTDSSILRRHMILIHKKDPKKWREDTENNVQRRTDFFISVVGDDESNEAKKTAPAGDISPPVSAPAGDISPPVSAPAGDISPPVSAPAGDISPPVSDMKESDAQTVQVNADGGAGAGGGGGGAGAGAGGEKVCASGESCEVQGIDDSGFSFIPVGVVPTAPSLETVTESSLPAPAHDIKQSHQNPAAEKMVNSPGHHSIEDSAVVHKANPRDTGAVTSYTMAVGSVLLTNSANKDSSQPSETPTIADNHSHLRAALITSYVAYDDQPRLLPAELYGTDVSQQLSQYSAVLAPGSGVGSQGFHNQSMVLMPADSDALSFHAEPVTVVTTTAMDHMQQQPSNCEEVTVLSSSSSSPSSS